MATLLCAALLAVFAALPAMAVAGGAATPMLILGPDRGPCDVRPIARGSGFPAGSVVALTGERTRPPGGKRRPPPAAAVAADDAINVLASGAETGGAPFAPPGTAYTFADVAAVGGHDHVARAVFAHRPGAPPPRRCFPETGHCMWGRFLAHWKASGGLARNGFPLGGERHEVLEDGKEYAVQYFERVRLEYHPENPAPLDVLLGQFGRRVLAEADLPGSVPELVRLYLASERLQGQVGQPVGPAARATGGYRVFERGAILWRGDTRAIYVLCGGDRRTGDDVRGTSADTWQEGDAPGPLPGFQEPGRGLDKLWRENAAVRDCLGYATNTVETASTMVVEPYRRTGFDNLLLGVETPGGRAAYAVYHTFLGSSSSVPNPALCRPDYERYPTPHARPPAPDGTRMEEVRP
jgi:hypothetical protein